MSRPQWPLAALLTMLVAVFLSVTTETLPIDLLPVMSRDLGVTEGQLGLIVTAFALMVALFAAPLGVVVARLPRRRLLIAALFGYASCNLITAVSHAYPVTVAGRLLGGLAHGVFWGMLGGYVSRIVAPDRIGRAMTFVSAGGAMAGLAGVPLGTALGTALGWRWAFAGLGTASLVLGVIAVRLLPVVPGRTPADRPPLRVVIRLPGLAPILSVTTLVMLARFSCFTYFAPLLLATGLTEDRVAPALLLQGLIATATLLLCGLIADRRPRTGLVVGSVAQLACLVLLVVAGGSPLAVVAAGTVVGLAFGSLPLLLLTAALHTAPGAPEQASALGASAFNIGIAGGALLGGVVLDRWGVAALPAMAVVLSLAGLLTLVLNRRVGLVPVAEPGL